MSNNSKVVRLFEYEVKDRSLAPIASQLGIDPDLTSAYTTGTGGDTGGMAGTVYRSPARASAAVQQERSNLILGILVGLSFTGLLLVLAPIVLGRRYPRKKLSLSRFSLLSAFIFVVVGNVFVGIYAVTRFAQTIVSTVSNPQLSLTESTFDFLIKNSDELASIGPGIIEPTLRAIEQDPSAPALESIITNFYIFAAEVEVYQSVLGVAKLAAGIFSLIPLVLLLLAFAVVLRNALPTMKSITRLPGNAARGIERAGRTTINTTARSIGREIVYALALIGVLLIVTFAIAATGTVATEPALQVMLNYLLASLVYLQLAENASPGLVFFSIVSTLFYLVLGMTLTVGAAGIFLFKASRLLRHSTREGFRSTRQRRFWLAGFGGLVWLMLFPIIYGQIAGSIVSGLIQLGVNYRAWGFIFVTSPLVMLGMFFIAFWAANGLRTIVFIWRFAPEQAVPPPPDEPEPITYPDAVRGSLLKDVTVQVINEEPPDELESSDANTDVDTDDSEDASGNISNRETTE